MSSSAERRQPLERAKLPTRHRSPESNPKLLAEQPAAGGLDLLLLDRVTVGKALVVDQTAGERPDDDCVVTNTLTQLDRLRTSRRLRSTIYSQGLARFCSAPWVFVTELADRGATLYLPPATLRW